MGMVDGEGMDFMLFVDEIYELVDYVELWMLGNV